MVCGDGASELFVDLAALAGLVAGFRGRVGGPSVCEDERFVFFVDSTAPVVLARDSATIVVEFWITDCPGSEPEQSVFVLNLGTFATRGDFKDRGVAAVLFS
jgi:hypothetical protein